MEKDYGNPRKEGIENFKRKIMEKRHKKRFPEDEDMMGVSVEAASPEGLEEGLGMAKKVLPVLSEAAEEGKEEAREEGMPETMGEEDFELVGEDEMEDDIGVEVPEDNLEEVLAGVPIDEIEAILAKMKAEMM